MRFAWFLVLLASCSAVPSAPADEWRLVILGIAQDGGMPHAGCEKPPCREARAGRRRAERVACIGVVHRGLGAAYLFDATPDFPDQLSALTAGKPPSGIFLTHAHIGHYAGLMYLGKETMAARGVPVYGTARMGEFLSRNAPWNLLLTDGHVDFRRIEPDGPVELPGGLRVTALTVPHRDEFTDTVGYLVQGPRARALFIPDIDKWSRWDRDIRKLADEVDLLLVDGTFSSPDELPGRDLTKIPHPLMTETRELLKGTRAELRFIHLNHSNPALLNGPDAVREGMEFPL